MSGILTTTNLTNIYLHGYSGINGLSIDGVGGKYAVSFDEGVTWKAWGGSAWTDITDISTQGMSREAITSLTPSQWGQIFERTQLDIMAYLTSGIVDAYTQLDPNTIVGVTLSTNNTVATISGGYTNRVKGTYRSSGKYYFEARFDNYGMCGVLTRDAINWQSTNGSYMVYAAATSLYKNGIDSGTIDASNHITLVKTVGYAIDINARTLMIYVNGVLKSTTTGITAGEYAPALGTGGASGGTTATFNLGGTAFTYTPPTGYLAWGYTEESLTSITLSLPDNSGPSILGAALSTTTTHKEVVNLTASINDIDDDEIQYRILINGEVFKDWTNLQAAPLSVNEALPFDEFPLSPSTSTIDLEARDSEGHISTQGLTVSRSNTISALTVLEASSQRYRATLGDSDNDTVKYRLYLNGVLKRDWSELLSSPLSIDYTIPRGQAVVGQQNEVLVEYLDELGQGGSHTESFVGTYTGLIFFDENGSAFIDSVGNILMYLDFGTCIAGSTVLSQKVVLSNLTGYTLTNVQIDVENDIGNTTVEMSEDEAFTEGGVQTLYIPQINASAISEFYVRASSQREAESGGTFKLKAKGTVVW